MKSIQITPDKITKLKKNQIFVFGSNLAGKHLAGAALLALNKFGAVYGQGVGIAGKSYALPTKDQNIQSRELKDIKESVERLIQCIELNPSSVFLITEVGCGLAGFTPDQIAPLFKPLHESKLENYTMPKKFIDVLSKGLKKGYKVTNSDMYCRDFKYELGKVYVHSGRVNPCSSGFHYCPLAVDCFEYYSFTHENRVFEIIDHGNTVAHDDKMCTSSIELVRELTWHEVLTLVNSGKDNTGRRNSGNWNSGNRNSGNWNSGNRNSGDSNSGNRNSGDSNSGNWNSGNRNSGNWNSGNRNSGDSNSGYRNDGAFCADPNPYVRLFDKETKIKVKDWENSRVCQLMYNINPNIWVESSIMSKEEKESFPTHETTGGYLKRIPMKEAWSNFWHNLPESDKTLFTSLTNFDSGIFEQITGIKIKS